MRKGKVVGRVWTAFVVLVVVVVCALSAPKIQKNMDECADLHGIYVYKSATCIYPGGIKYMW